VRGRFVIAADREVHHGVYEAGLTPDGFIDHSICADCWASTRDWSLQFSIQLLSTSRRSIWESSHAWSRRGTPRDCDRVRLELATWGRRSRYRGVKRLLIASAVAGLEEQMGRETETICAARMDQDGTRGHRGFVEKRRPKFHRRVILTVFLVGVVRSSTRSEVSIAKANWFFAIFVGGRFANRPTRNQSALFRVRPID